MKVPPELERYQLLVEQRLGELLARIEGPERLREAMSYSLMAGGKRLRPLLLLATHDLFDPTGLDPMPAACALELIHTYSLIHDDLPAMDDDDWRRGKPTNHKMFGEAMAILAGDALLTEAFGLMARSCGEHTSPTAVRGIAEVARAAGSAGMVGGQVLDVLDTGRPLDRAQLERMHRMKTGALLVAATRCGAILGGADEADLRAVTRYGQAVGLAFQVADDVLDVIGTRESLGKTAGKDRAQGKNTYVALLGLDRAREYVEELTVHACRALERFGERAALLRSLAEFVRDSVGAMRN